MLGNCCEYVTGSFAPYVPPVHSVDYYAPSYTDLILICTKAPSYHCGSIKVPLRRQLKATLHARLV